MTPPSRSPRAPSGLAHRGGSFWRRRMAEFDFGDGEIELLVEICRALDEAEALHRVVVEQGSTVAGSRGQITAHPCLSELRQTRLMLGRLLSQLALPDEDGDSLTSPLSARGRKAARTRWAKQKGSA